MKKEQTSALSTMATSVGVTLLASGLPDIVVMCFFRLIYLRQTVSSKIVFLRSLRQEGSLKSGFSFRMVLKTKEAHEPVGSIVTACCRQVSLAWWSRISTT